jgi:hypothetical protein
MATNRTTHRSKTAQKLYAVRASRASSHCRTNVFGDFNDDLGADESIEDRLNSSAALLIQLSDAGLVVPNLLITPGDSSFDETYVVPPRTCPCPMMRAMRSALSMPFCRGSTNVSCPTSGRIACAAVSVSWVFTQNSTRSTETMLGSSVTCTLRVSSPADWRPR